MGIPIDKESPVSDISWAKGEQCMVHITLQARSTGSFFSPGRHLQGEKQKSSLCPLCLLWWIISSGKPERHRKWNLRKGKSTCRRGPGDPGLITPQGENASRGGCVTTITWESSFLGYARKEAENHLRAGKREPARLEQAEINVADPGPGAERLTVVRLRRRSLYLRRRGERPEWWRCLLLGVRGVTRP